MTYASKSASFRGRTGAAAVRKCLPVFRTQKRNARLSARNLATSEPRSSLDDRSETQEMKAFEEMVVALRSKFLAIANAILQNRDDAEDAVQDAFLSGYLHFPSFEGRSALTTWFTRIVMNAALMIRRKQKLRWMSPRPEASAPAERETFQFINEALAKMKPALRQAFTMTYYDEMSSPEARALLGVSTAAFKSRLLRARRQLLNEVQRARVAPIRRATVFFPYKNGFEPLDARHPGAGSEEGS
jgi:RNA polymerase sigma-70 factor (ECF subfamily)